MREDRFEIFKKACKNMDEDKWYDAYQLLRELMDDCLNEAIKSIKKKADDRIQ